MKTDILLLCPLQGNGGIQSWTRTFISNFPDDNYCLYPVDVAPDKLSTHFRGIDPWIYGAKTFVRAYRDIGKQLRKNPQIQLMHTTTSGGNGVLRDYFLGKFCKKRGLRIIMHCRFGSVGELYRNRGWKGLFFRKSLNIYNQIWVLDQYSLETLKSNNHYKDKVFLVPNPIEIQNGCDLSPKQYRRVGFIGNILPSKGIFELVDAVISLNDKTELYIAGEGAKEDIKRIMKTAENNRGRIINFYGRLSNIKAVQLMSKLDILCLPTYYDMEAFPISILEAMSRGKLVISCPRAAIPDMLTAMDGSQCGLLVDEKSSQAIAAAIKWCQEHNEEADLMCKKAYEKVRRCYRQEIVYDIYREKYKLALSKNE